MSYQRQSNQLNIRTAPTNVGGYQPRSAIADAFQGAQALLQSGVNLQNTRIQNESRELSLHTQILQAEAQEAERVQAERRAAAARAERARNIDIQQNYLTEVRAAELALEQGLREAGSDPELRTVATNTFTGIVETLREGLPEAVYDSTFNQSLSTVSAAQSNLNESIHQIRAGEFEQTIGDFSLVHSGMGVSLETIGGSFSAMQERGQELGYSPNQVAETIVTQRTDYAVGTADFNNMSLEERQEWVAGERAWNETIVAQDPYVVGKPYWNSRLERISEVELGINQELLSRNADAIASGDEELFTTTLTQLQSSGFVDDYETVRLENTYTQALLERQSDPDALAMAAMNQTQGLAPSVEVFPDNQQARNKYETMQDGDINTTIANPSLEGDERLRTHMELGTPHAVTQLNRGISRATGTLQRLLTEQPADLNSEEGQQWMQEVARNQQQVARLQDIGGRHVSESNRASIALTSAALTSGVDLTTYFERVDASGGNVSPVGRSSEIGQHIVEAIPEDRHAEALLYAGSLSEFTDFSDEEIIEQVNATYEYIEVGDVSVSPQAVQMLSSNGISSQGVQDTFVEMITDSPIELFGEDIGGNIQRIAEGDNFRIVTAPDGNFRLTSSNGTLTLPLTQQQWEALSLEVTAAHDVANLPVGERAADYVSSLRTSEEIGTVMTDAFDDMIVTFNNMTPEQAVAVREGLTATQQDLTAANENLVADLQDGIPEEQASQSYLQDIVPSVMDIAEAKLGRQLTQSEEQALREFLVDDGMVFLQNNSGGLGRSTDGLLSHMSDVATRFVGADVLSRSDARQARILEQQQAVRDAQEALDNAEGTRNINAAQRRLEGAQEELRVFEEEGYYRGIAPVTDASGNVVTPYAEGSEAATTTTTSSGDAPNPVQLRIASNNVEEAEAEVQRLQGLIDGGGDRRATNQWQGQLESAVERLRTEREALDALLGNSN